MTAAALPRPNGKVQLDLNERVLHPLYGTGLLKAVDQNGHCAVVWDDQVVRAFTAVDELTSEGHSSGALGDATAHSVPTSIRIGNRDGRRGIMTVLHGTIRWDDDGSEQDQELADRELEGVLERHRNYEQRVDREYDQLKAREAAKVRYAAENAPEVPPFDAGTLAEVLARPDDPPHRVAGLMPWGASTLLVAQRKTGKTTMVLNLARSFLTGTPLLGRFDVRPVEGKVAILNYEVSAAMLAGWARDSGVPEERLVLVNLRGRRNPLLHDADRARLADLLAQQQVETLIVDPFGRAFGGRNQNDAAEVGSWLVNLDAFARAEAGVLDVVLTAHTGWEAERSRGSSALEDWPDVVITMTRDKEDNRTRYLAAEGRDVLLDEDRLDFDPVTRTLNLAGAGSRTKARAFARQAELTSAVVEAVTNNPGSNTAEIEKKVREAGLGFQRGEVGKVGRSATHAGVLRQEHGPRNSVLWFPRVVSAPESPDYSRWEPMSTPHPSYRGGDYSLTFDEASAPEGKKVT